MPLNAYAWHAWDREILKTQHQITEVIINNVSLFELNESA